MSSAHAVTRRDIEDDRRAKRMNWEVMTLSLAGSWIMDAPCGKVRHPLKMGMSWRLS